MFDNIAPHYDFLNHFLSLGIDRKWRKKTIKTLVGNNPQKILDIATGTGDLAVEIKKQFPNSRVTGLDLSPGMIALAEKKVQKKGIEGIDLLVGDSENLPFEDNSFDAITVAFGVRNFGDLPAGLKEMNRVLKKGGRVAILEFSKPRSTPFKQLFGFYFSNLLPFIGRFQSKDKRAYSYLQESVQEFPDYELFQSKLEENGFNNLYFKVLTLGVCCIYVAEK